MQVNAMFIANTFSLVTLKNKDKNRQKELPESRRVFLLNGKINSGIFTQKVDRNINNSVRRFIPSRICQLRISLEERSFLQMSQ